MRRLKFLAFTLIALIIAPSAASALDIPLLTWERGREQQVVLGGGAYSQSWTVTLEGNGANPLTFTASEKNDAGYVVYSVRVPSDYPIGAYSIVTIGEGSPRTVVAGVNLIYAQTQTVASNLFDLTLIIAIFVFLTGIVSTIRARKYLYIPFRSTQLLPENVVQVKDSEENIWDRLESAPYRLRIQSLITMQPSLFRFLLLREGEMSHRISKKIYGLMPIIGLIAGSIAAIEVARNDGISSTPMTIFIFVAAIAIFDASAGATAMLGFWGGQILNGHVSSFRDVLISLAVGIGWAGPSLFAALLRETINRDYSEKKIRGVDSIKYLGILGSSAVGAAVFYLSQALINSVIYTEQDPRAITWLHIAIVASLLVAKGIADDIYLKPTNSIATKDESFFIARVSSPITAITVFTLVFAFVYIWTESAVRSFFVAIIFSLPYILIFVRFTKTARIRITQIPRNILLESALIAGFAFVVFRQISLKPLLLDQRADLLLLITAIFPVLHAIYSAIYSSNEEKFSFDENPEIIKP